MISETARILPGVHLGEGTTVEDFCLVGATNGSCGGAATSIGAGALLRAFTVIYAGNEIGARFQTGNKANIREHNRIGDDVSIGSLSVVEHHVEIGNRVRIHTQAFVPEYTILEDDCWIGPNVVLTNAKYPRAPDAKATLQGPRVRSGAIVGANATILPGVEIGPGALVGAGSVVTRDVPGHVIVAGNPAKVIRERSP